MKAIVCVFFYLCICSCNKAGYYGYVYDFDKKAPIDSVIVYDRYSGKKALTNQKGYFKIGKIPNVSATLIFSKENYQNDTVRSIKIQSGEMMEEKFKGEKIYLFSLKSAFKDSILKANTIK
ncbi:hypothetical protein ABIB40_003667 [Pedobacter sp. UYP30]|uniref:carboxypeptidase-like regulatory domain-containing protein n=1 Tax=Pedobacter sp. UYP30 TaxID=1756400 RepID=UPI003398DFDB